MNFQKLLKTATLCCTADVL